VDADLSRDVRPGEHLMKIPMISIVDDDKSVREATKGLVRSLGYVAVAYASAEEFLQSNRVDETRCLITDMRMPGLSGVELQNLLIEQGRRIPMIFITAFIVESIRKQAMNAGAVGFLSKPFDEQCLIDHLNTAVTGPESIEK
jgi:FixJ family two-component response regulator